MFVRKIKTNKQFVFLGFNDHHNSKQHYSSKPEVIKMTQFTKLHASLVEPFIKRILTINIPIVNHSGCLVILLLPCKCLAQSIQNLKRLEADREVVYLL